MVGQLLSDRDISTRLSLSVNTVKTHVKHVRRKLGVDSRKEVARALRTDLWLPSDLAHRHDWSGASAAAQPE
jgi:DNA-binding NarL/FixJ family response regulator